METVRYLLLRQWRQSETHHRLFTVILFSLQVRAGLPRSGAAHDLDGISSIVVVLEGYNSLISETLHGVAQIKYDISSLTGYLVHWKLGHCSEQRPKPPVPGPLQELQSQKEHVDTVSPEALVRVKDFVKQLLKNLNQLEMC